MKASGFLELGTDLVNADFAAMGIHGGRVEGPGDLPGGRGRTWP